MKAKDTPLFNNTESCFLRKEPGFGMLAPLLVQDLISLLKYIADITDI